MRFRDPTRINERIRAHEVRVVLSTTGQQLGVMKTREAVALAKRHGMDLVEIAANAKPPVCRIVDYGKHKYEQAKLQKERGKKTGGKMKEIKLRVRTDEHDYRIKMARAEEFLDQNNKVKVSLQFRGRELAHTEIGFEVLGRVIEDLDTMANVDMKPRMVGRAVNMTLSPLPKHMRKRVFHATEEELSRENEAHEAEDAELDHEQDDNHEPTGKTEAQDESTSGA